MAQHDMNIANQGFPAFRADLNSALTAIANNSSGATEPSTTFAYQWWYDTSTNALKMRNADNDAWIEIGTFNQTTDSFTPSGVTSDSITEGNSSVEVVDTGTGYVAVTVDGVETARFDNNGRLGVGTSSPQKELHIVASQADIRLEDNSGTSNYGEITYVDGRMIFSSDKGNALGSSTIEFQIDNDEKARITSGGNLLVGRTSSSETIVGAELNASGHVIATRDGGEALILNRLTSEGIIARFRLSGSTVAAIGVNGGAEYFAGEFTGMRCGSTQVSPCGADGVGVDNQKDLGASSLRWDDIYATNGTIQTSDANEKQDIAELTSSEMAVAKRLSALFKTFRWIDSVEEKGDDARVHSGVIAQDVEAAFAAEGLDAGKYALFISTTWWEKEVTVPAVEGKDAVYDEEGNLIEEAVEAKDAYVRIDQCEEGEEGAVERNRKGIRYPQLLSFLAAYNEQRFASIEDRLNALESA